MEISQPANCLRRILDRVESLPAGKISLNDRDAILEAITDDDTPYKVAECQVPDCAARFTVMSLLGRITIMSEDIPGTKLPCESVAESVWQAPEEDYDETLRMKARGREYRRPESPDDDPYPISDAGYAMLRDRQEERVASEVADEGYPMDDRGK